MLVFQIKRIIWSEKWFNYVFTFCFYNKKYWKNAKNLGRSDNAKWKKRGWPNITPKDKKLFVIYFLCIHVELCFIIFGLSCLTAKKHLTELQKRLDTTERTMHLVMKQMEAVTKCLAKTLAEDPSMSGDKSLAEITEGLVNLKESNVWVMAKERICHSNTCAILILRKWT